MTDKPHPMFACQSCGTERRISRRTDRVKYPCETCESVQTFEKARDVSSIELADLIDRDGNVNARIARGGRHNTMGSVEPDDCEYIRQTIVKDETSATLAEEISVTKHTVRNHAAGRCECDVETPPRTGDCTGTWVKQ